MTEKGAVDVISLDLEERAHVKDRAPRGRLRDHDGVVSRHSEEALNRAFIKGLAEIGRGNGLHPVDQSDGEGLVNGLLVNGLPVSSFRPGAIESGSIVKRIGPRLVAELGLSGDWAPRPRMPAFRAGLIDVESGSAPSPMHTRAVIRSTCTCNVLPLFVTHVVGNRG